MKHVTLLARQRPVLAQEKLDEDWATFFNWYNFFIDVAIYLVSFFGTK